jgi:hypothetical protein
MSRAKSFVLGFWNDQTGFVLTAELVLISTLLVLGLIVGLTSVQAALVGELGDVGDAIGSLNQSYYAEGFVSRKAFHYDGGVKSFTAGSAYRDLQDECDADLAGPALSCAFTPPLPEAAIPSQEHKHSQKKDKDDDDDDDKKSKKDKNDDDDDKKSKKDKDDDDDDDKKSKKDKDDNDD